MNELSVIAFGAFLSLVGAVFNGLLFFWLRGIRDDFREMARKVELVDSKSNENRESIARLEGRFGRLGTQQNWRE